MSDIKTLPGEDLIIDNKVVITELPEKTQKLIEKFKAETDVDKKDALDEAIYGQVDDFLEAKVAEAKKAATKAKISDHKKKKLDVSGAATAKTAEQEADEKKKATATEEPGILKKYYGLG